MPVPPTMFGNQRGAASTGTYGADGVSFTPAAYGSVPNPTAIPKSIYQEAQAADPALTGLAPQTASVIGSQLGGQLSTETINSIQDHAAQFGVASGMPGSGLAGHGGARDLGLSVEALQQQGLGNYQNALKTLGSMQLDPSLTSSINTYNNQLAAAPTPAAAAAQEEALWQAHYAQTRGPAGGTGGGGPTTITGAGLGFKPTGGPVPGTNPFGFGGGVAGGNSTGAPDVAYGYNSAGVFGDMSGQSPWSAPAAPAYGASFGTGQGGGAYADPYMGAAPGDPSYDAMLDPSSADYQPQGAQ